MDEQKKLKCNLPFTFAKVDHKGNVFSCHCPAWLKRQTPMGNINQTPLKEIWNNQAYQDMRQGFLEGRYDDFCYSQSCPYLNGNGTAESPSSI